MTTLAWLTDIHLNFLPPHRFGDFIGEILSHAPDAVLISGDIGESNSVVYYLQRMAQQIQKPIYFVLGNHDYYRGSFESVTAAMRVACGQTPQLVWLNDAGVVELAPGVALIGHDSWADGRLGDYENSEIMMTDYVIIDDFAGLDKAQRLQLLNRRGDAAAAYFRDLLPQALATHDTVYLVTHYPPFARNCVYNGRVTRDDFLPHLGCKAVGDVLVEIMQAHPHKQLNVLCGHTHHPVRADILPNLLAITGQAEYRKPRVEAVLTV